MVVIPALELLVLTGGAAAGGVNLLWMNK